MNKINKIVLFISIMILVIWIFISGLLLMDYLFPLLMESVNRNPEFYRWFMWFSILGGSLLPILIILNSEYMSQFNKIEEKENEM